MRDLGRGLQTRTEALVAVGVLVPLLVLGGLAASAVERLSDRIQSQKELLSRSVADRLEDALRHDLAALLGASILELTPETLRGAPRNTRFVDRFFLLDEAGAPASDDLPPALLGALAPTLQETRRSGRMTASPMCRVDSQPRLFVLVPLRHPSGRTFFAGASLDPTRHALSGFLSPYVEGDTGVVELLDQDGAVVAAAGPRRPSASPRNAAIASPELVADAPLTTVPWGVRVRQRRSEALAPLVTLRWQVVGLAPVLLGFAYVFAWGAARSVRRPLQLLTGAAERIASGDVTSPIPPLPEDEVGQLGRSLETMRHALADTLARLTAANEELERRVARRTEKLEALAVELNEREARRLRLLRKLLTAQEEERKRIARELHDDTCQAVAVLSVGLDAVETAPPAEARARLGELKALAGRTLDGLHRVIYDLRPSLLDDLGLFPALRWFVAHRVEPHGITVHCEIDGDSARLPGEVETAVFRVVQEALTNVVRHANAETVLLQAAATPAALTIEIEDDGDGFELDSARPEASGRGLGLLGMHERAELVSGTVDIDSEPGNGTRVTLKVPLAA